MEQEQLPLEFRYELNSSKFLYIYILYIMHNVVQHKLLQTTPVSGGAVLPPTLLT